MSETRGVFDNVAHRRDWGLRFRASTDAAGAARWADHLGALGRPIVVRVAGVGGCGGGGTVRRHSSGVLTVGKQKLRNDD